MAISEVIKGTKLYSYGMRMNLLSGYYKGSFRDASTPREFPTEGRFVLVKDDLAKMRASLNIAPQFTNPEFVAQSNPNGSFPAESMAAFNAFISQNKSCAVVFDAFKYPFQKDDFAVVGSLLPRQMGANPLKGTRSVLRVDDGKISFADVNVEGKLEGNMFPVIKVLDGANVPLPNTRPTNKSYLIETNLGEIFRLTTYGAVSQKGLTGVSLADSAELLKKIAEQFNFTIKRAFCNETGNESIILPDGKGSYVIVNEDAWGYSLGGNENPAPSFLAFSAI
jgi:hypothetical protein